MKQRQIAKAQPFVLGVVLSLMVSLTACQPIQPVAVQPAGNSAAAELSTSVACEDAETGKVVLMRDYFERLNAGDLDAALELFASDAVVMAAHAPRLASAGKVSLPFDTFVGREAIAQFIGGAIAVGVKVTLEEPEVVGDRVTAQGMIYTTYYAEALHVPEFRATLAMTIRNCQIEHYDVALAYEEIVDLQQQMEAVAVAERRDIVDEFSNEVFNLANLAVVDELVDPSVVLHHPLYGEMSGIEGVRQWGASAWDLFPEFGITYEVMPIAPNVFVKSWVAEGIHGVTGNQATFDGYTIYRVENGKIVEIWQHFDTLELLQQIGAVPSAE